MKNEQTQPSVSAGRAAGGAARVVILYRAMEEVLRVGCEGRAQQRMQG